jgi:polar amino acid transport system ATP-binding protein
MQPNSNMPIVLANVFKSFGNLQVLKNVSFEVAIGEVVALIGPSGSGKSTLLRCINHLEVINGGRIYVNGKLIGYAERNGMLYELSDKGASLQRRSTGMVFQSFNLFRHLTAIENIMSGPLYVLKRPKSEARQLALELLDKVGLKEKERSYPAELSGGQQQRVAIARALAMDPKVLLLDEPTSALDPELSGEVITTIRSLSEQGQTMLIATHEMALARDVADRVVFIEDGCVVEQSTAKTFFSAPTSERACQFLKKLAAGQSA